MNEKPKSKSGCGCAFGIAGCFTIIALSVVLLIVLTVSAVIWVKHRTYVNQAEKTQEVASKICEYKLPESFTPVISFDYNFLRGAVFAKKEKKGENNVATIVLLDTTLTNFCDFFDESMMRVAVTPDNGEKVVVRTINLSDYDNGGTKISRQEKLIYIEEDNTAVTIYKGSFPKEERMVYAWYFAVGLTNTPADAKALIKSLH